MRLDYSLLSDQGVYKVQRRLLLSHLVYHVFYDQGFLAHREVSVPVPFCFQPGFLVVCTHWHY